MGWMIQSGTRLIAKFEGGRRNDGAVRESNRERLDRARVLLDLALLAGTRFVGGSLVEWTLPSRHGLVNPRTVHWCDSAGRAIPAEEVAAPSGLLTLRQHALRVAWLLWLRAYGWPCFEEAGDIPMLAVVTLADPSTDVSRAICARVERWPAAVQERWRAAYHVGWRHSKAA